MIPSFSFAMKINVSAATTLIQTAFAFQHIAVGFARGAGIWNFDDIVVIYETLIRDLGVDELEETLICTDTRQHYSMNEMDLNY